jgi:hypothetical protein
MIDFIETHVEFILEFLHVLIPLDGESFWPRNNTHPVTRPNAFVVLTIVQGSKGEQAITHVLLEVTSPEAVLTGMK